MKNWRDWFVEPDDEDPMGAECARNAEARIEAGSGHLDETIQLKRKTPPRCAKCKRFMGFGDGMYILITHDWRIHINCFNKVIEEHFKQGEVIDLETGNIMKIEVEDE